MDKKLETLEKILKELNEKTSKSLALIKITKSPYQY